MKSWRGGGDMSKRTAPESISQGAVSSPPYPPHVSVLGSPERQDQQDIYLSVCLSVYLSIIYHLSIIHLLSIYLSSIYLSIYLSSSIYLLKGIGSNSLEAEKPPDLQSARGSPREPMVGFPSECGLASHRSPGWLPIGVRG